MPTPILYDYDANYMTHHDTTRLTNTVQYKTRHDKTFQSFSINDNTRQTIKDKTTKYKTRQDKTTKYVQTTTPPRLDSKHSCPSGLRGPSQERLSRDAWVRIPPDAFCFFRPQLPPLTTHTDEQSTRHVDLTHKKRRGCSSDGRAFVSHTRGKGIDTPHLHFTDLDDDSTPGHQAKLQLPNSPPVILTVHAHACF